MTTTPKKPYEPLPGYVLVMTADQVTDEVIDMVRSIEEGWFNGQPIDWEAVWERLEGSTLNDGQQVDLGPDMDSPAMRKMQRVIRAERRAG